MLWLLLVLLGSYALVTLAWAVVSAVLVGTEMTGPFIFLPPLAFVLISLFVGGIDAVTGIILVPLRLMGMVMGMVMGSLV